MVSRAAQVQHSGTRRCYTCAGTKRRIRVLLVPETTERRVSVRAIVGTLAVV